MTYWEESKDTVVLKFYGIISCWWQGADDFTKTIQQLEAKYTNLKIRMHCYGGEVMEGSVIYNAIKQSKLNVTVYIDGVAASMASIVMLAAKKIYIAENAFVMIHVPQGYTVGNSKQHFEVGKLLKSMEKNFAREYARKTRKSETAVAEWFDGADHWFSAEEAKANGLVDEIITPIVQDVRDLGKPDTKDQEEQLFARFAATLTTVIPNSNNHLMKKDLIEKFSLSGLTAESSDTAFLDALSNKFTGMQTQLNNLQANQAGSLITAAEVAAGKSFTDDQKAKLNDIASKAGIEALQSVLAISLPTGAGSNQQTTTQPTQVPITSVMASKTGASGVDEKNNWNFRDWCDKDEKGLAEMRDKEPAKYKALFKAEYGNEPEL